MEGNKKLAITFWKEFRDRFFDLFVHSGRPILVQSPPRALDRFAQLVERAVRFMFCLEKETINQVRNQKGI